MSSPSPRFDAYMERASEKQAQWRSWFALWPVKINGRRVWLKMVERRVPSHYDEFLRGWRPDYPTRIEYRMPNP